MGRLRYGLPPAVVAALAVAVAASGAHAQKSRILDRTLLCEVELSGGIHELNVYGQSGVRLKGSRSKWKELPSAHFANGDISAAGIAGVAAGRSDSTMQVASGLWYDAKRCKRTSARVALGPKGLGGGQAGPFQERFECPSPKQVVIRLRAEFSRPADFDFSSRFSQYHAGGPPLERASLGATTTSGRPLAYVDVNESGRARLFFRGNCLRA